MINKNLLLKIPIYSILIWGISILILNTYHIYFYHLNSEIDCQIYKQMTPDEIFNLFKDDYTKQSAAIFFSKCKIKNAAPLIYYLPDYYNNSSPFGFNLYEPHKNISPLGLFQASNEMLEILFNIKFELNKSQKFNQENENAKKYSFFGKKK